MTSYCREFASNPELNQVCLDEFEALCDAVEWRSRAFILFHKEILHAGLVLMLENCFEINDSVSDFRKTLIGFFGHVFYMPEWKSSGMFLEQSQRVLARFFNPI
jgi:hypothetical protein